MGGSQRIPILVAKKLGSQVVLKSPVRRIEQHRGKRGRHLRPDGRRGARGDRRGAAEAGARASTSSPGLPAVKRKLLKGTPPGNLIKWEAVYDTPFWRDDGYSGQAVSEQGPANTTFDNTPPGGQPGHPVRLRRRQAGALVPRSSARAARRKAVLDNFVTYFGAEARQPEERRSSWTGRRRRGRAAARSGTPAQRAAPLRARAAQAVQARPLGRHRDGRLLERLHGRRRALGRAGREGGRWGRCDGEAARDPGAGRRRDGVGSARRARRRRSARSRRRELGREAYRYGVPLLEFLRIRREMTSVTRPTAGATRL